MKAYEREEELEAYKRRRRRGAAPRFWRDPETL
jgi:hypothetical protein